MLKSIAWRAILREPLVHFLVIGFFIFLYFSWRGEPVDPASRVIVIDEARVARLSAGWQQMRQRPPTPKELDGLIRDYIKEEIYYREALRLGLDQDDPGIRRRLRLKMEYIAAAEIENFQPDDSILAQWLQSNPARYAAGVRLSFDQLYFAATDADAANARARKALAALNQGADWRQQGDRISLPQSVEAAQDNEVARQFGEPFAAALARQPVGRWSGPVASGFGLHLVKVRKVDIPQPPRLQDVRQQVENDWRAATAKNREARAYQALLDGYTIKLAP